MDICRQKAIILKKYFLLYCSKPCLFTYTGVTAEYPATRVAPQPRSRVATDSRQLSFLAVQVAPQLRSHVATDSRCVLGWQGILQLMHQSFVSPTPRPPGIVGTYGEITRAITRDYATITPLGGREITRFSFLCPTPLGTYRGKYRGILTQEDWD